MTTPTRVLGLLCLWLALAAPAGLRAQADPEALDEATRLLRSLANPAAPAPANARPDPAPSRENAVPVREPVAPPNEPGLETAVPEVLRTYLLSPQDRIQVKVFNEDNLTTDARLSDEGVISFPLIGKVKLAGKTVEQAVELIREKLDRDYIINPQVNLTIVEFSKRRFTILGQVQKPGSYDIPDAQSLNLLQAISMAGGYTRIASPSKVTVQRVANGQKAIFNLDAKSMARSKDTKMFEVLPNDTITVSESIF